MKLIVLGIAIFFLSLASFFLRKEVLLYQARVEWLRADQKNLFELMKSQQKQIEVINDILEAHTTVLYEFLPEEVRAAYEAR